MGKRSKSRNRHQKKESKSTSPTNQKFSFDGQEETRTDAEHGPAVKRQRLSRYEDSTCSLGATIEQVACDTSLHVSIVGDGDSQETKNNMKIPPPINIGDISGTSPDVGIVKELGKIWMYLSRSKTRRRQKKKNLPKLHESMDRSDQDHQWQPTPIQQHAWSILLQDLPLVGIASTGSGKTFAYAIPILLLSVSPLSPCRSMPSSSSSSVLVIVPTRELVHQVSRACDLIVKAMRKTCNFSTGIRTVPIHGGVDRQAQLEELKGSEGNHQGDDVLVVIGTPGRLLDILNDECPTFRWIVLDEADQLTKEGDLGPQVDEILHIARKNFENNTDKHRCTMALVSATYPQKCQARFLQWVGTKHALVQVDNHHQNAQEKNPKVCDDRPSKLERRETVGSEGDEDKVAEAKDSVTMQEDQPVSSYSRIPSHLTQVLHVCAEHKKPRKLVNTLSTAIKELKQQAHENNNSNRSQQFLGIVFFNKIDKLKYVSKLLQKENLKCVELHSQLPRHVREQNLKRFSCGAMPLLLSTDLAARGIHIPQVRFVIQYDFPGNLDQYVHRCGRAGRAGQPAKIYSFFTRNFQPMAASLIQLLEANEQWVDPNLRLLVNDTSVEKPENEKEKKNSNTQKKREMKSTIQRNKVTDGVESNVAADDDEEEDDEFADLSPKRIVLQRASHVSDASSDDENDGE